MTQETIRALKDEELAQVIAWGQQEQQMRTAKRKQETIAKIKEMARSVKVNVKVEGVRGRPVKHKEIRPHRQGPA